MNNHTVHIGKSWAGDVRLVGTRSCARLLAALDKLLRLVP